MTATLLGASRMTQRIEKGEASASPFGAERKLAVLLLVLTALVLVMLSAFAVGRRSAGGRSGRLGARAGSTGRARMTVIVHGDLADTLAMVLLLAGCCRAGRGYGCSHLALGTGMGCLANL